MVKIVGYVITDGDSFLYDSVQDRIDGGFVRVSNIVPRAIFRNRELALARWYAWRNCGSHTDISKYKVVELMIGSVEDRRSPVTNTDVNSIVYHFEEGLRSERARCIKLIEHYHYRVANGKIPAVSEWNNETTSQLLESISDAIKDDHTNITD